ncbi:MAG: ATP-binding protein [Verrucomicrobia bacterium]|nr:ATP-binding protein [Verrucomicrobiota bacterium]
MAKSKTTPVEQPLAEQIRASEKSRMPVETMLATDERVLARITDGIYRQPSSALRELISNAYDADSAEVVILTDAPRFAQISIRDNGLGLSPEVLEHLIKHIGGSVKRSEEGKELGVTAKTDENRSPGGRQLIGKLGIGLFSVAQFTRHFLIITKTKGDTHRTIADITLGSVGGQQKLLPLKEGGRREIETGHARIWRERATDRNSHGTEVKLLDLLPRTRAELASDDLWTKIDYEKAEAEVEKTKPPAWHIGRMKPKQEELLEVQPQLPWDENDQPRERFEKFVNAVRDAAVETESVDLDIFLDRYLQTLWTLSVSAPLEYLEGHPFDLAGDEEFVFFEIENRARGQAKKLKLENGETPRKALRLKTPNGAPGERFDVFIDGVQLFRPILYRNLPKTKTAVKNPLLFIGHDSQKFEKKHVEMSGGPLVFEAYLFWSPRIIPKQHQGVILRVGNASGALFDRTFMGYQVSEQTRTRQITAEIFVREGLDGAINIDRESFNYAHPHYQYLVKWLHSALRQLANRHKEIGSDVRSHKLVTQGKRVREKVEEKVEAALKARGVEDVPEVVLLEPAKQSEARKLRSEGMIALRKNVVLPPSPAKYTTSAEGERRKLAEKKAVAVVQLLHGWGLLERLSFDEQEKLVRDILEIVLLEG